MSVFLEVEGNTGADDIQVSVDVEIDATEIVGLVAEPVVLILKSRGNSVGYKCLETAAQKKAGVNIRVRPVVPERIFQLKF